VTPKEGVSLFNASGAGLAHPSLSPLFGDVSGFPPTLLPVGARNIVLSNTVRMHRKLRGASVRAELHVWEAMPHGGFGGLTPEGRELSAKAPSRCGQRPAVIRAHLIAISRRRSVRSAGCSYYAVTKTPYASPTRNGGSSRS
jgi:acetyl esterase/lipase